MLNLGAKKHSYSETGQSSHFPLVPPNNPKTKLSTNYFASCFHTFETETRSEQFSQKRAIRFS